MTDIVLLGEAWGENEARIEAGFVGTSGVELLRQLHEADIIQLTSEDWSYIKKFWSLGDPTFIDMIWRLHPETLRTNVINQRPPSNEIAAFCGPREDGVEGYPKLTKSGFLHRRFEPELERLAAELVDANPNIIVCLGNTPLWALSGNVGVTKLRGTTFLTTHTVEGFKAIATYHPAAVQRQYEWRPTAIADLMKAKRESGYPEIRRLAREIWIEPTLEDIRRFRDEYITPSKCCSIDIETAGNRITCIGFSPDARLALVIPFTDARRKSKAYWGTKKDELEVWKVVRSILEDARVRKLFQNGLYDISFLWRSYGIRTLGTEHDTMLLHHALQPESLKGLGYLGSIYADEGAWKSMRGKVETIKGED